MDNTNRLYTSNNNRNKNGNAKKFESVKQLKKLWESESELTNPTSNGVSKSSRNLNLSDAVKSFNEFKKWSSMQQISPSPPTPVTPATQLLPITITTPPSNVVYDSADVEPREETEAVYEEVRAPPTPPPLPPPPLLIDPTTVDNETRSNMSNVLEEIKRFDHTKPKRIEIDKIMTATATASASVAAPQIRGHTSRVDQSRAAVYSAADSGAESSSHLVKKLKQKFDNKDQSFIKVRLRIYYFLILFSSKLLNFIILKFSKSNDFRIHNLAFEISLIFYVSN